MRTIIHKYSGKSLLQLREKFSTGFLGFYNNGWWIKEKFASEKPPKGTYEINISNDLVNLTYGEQLEKLEKGWKPTHPAILAEAILSHYKETGERLVETYWLRTSSVASDGYRVDVGRFGSGGLSVSGDWDGYRYDHLGVSSAWKSTKKLEIGNLDPVEDLIIEIKGQKYKLEKINK